MKRVGLKQEFHGEPDPTQEGLAAERDEKRDEVGLDVVGGTVSFVVPSDVPDDEITKIEYIERHVNGVLQLENGAELLFWIIGGAYGVDLRVKSESP